MVCIFPYRFGRRVDALSRSFAKASTTPSFHPSPGRTYPSDPDLHSLNFCEDAQDGSLFNLGLLLTTVSGTQ
ncbi:hypothetical protein SAMN02982997_01141 [Legionella micdadei]|uniref:Uncharacterized protein n=1 Tax=Legionella micdadei TaxID=451 RepID=A0A1G5E8I4_LEGMI|nr:hypothetical protein [Legionella micdadei]KTD26517.1 hypothetical protein Lmic_2611 [Legionella micdadei]SCY22808.1 hypothetical protein SAMN02982997_01141 [Legionella micdadei]